MPLRKERKAPTSKTCICVVTGFEFETLRKRDTHPDVAAWEQAAYSEGWSEPCRAALYGRSKEAFTSVEQMNEFFREMQARMVPSIAADRDARFKRERAEKEARETLARERYYTNSILSKNGYKWHKVGFANEEEADAFSPNLPIGQEWMLFTPDNHSVSVTEAMQELARQDVTSAKTWLAEREVAQ